MTCVHWRGVWEAEYRFAATCDETLLVVEFSRLLIDMSPAAPRLRRVCVCVRVCVRVCV